MDLRAELDQIKAKSFVKTYKATDEEAIGLLLSRFFKWDGACIMKAASYALEDSNFHTESDAIDEMVKKVEAEAKAQEDR